jgi:hypothetical protein
MAPKAPVTVTGTAAVRAIDERLILPLPQEASAQLPSRGQVAVHAVLGGHERDAVVEPDGRRGPLAGPARAAGPRPRPPRGTARSSSPSPPRRTGPSRRSPHDLAAALEERRRPRRDLAVADPDGALGMGALDRRDPQRGHPREARRRLDRQAPGRLPPPLLLRPLLLHRPGARPQRQAAGLISAPRSAAAQPSAAAPPHLLVVRPGLERAVLLDHEAAGLPAGGCPPGSRAASRCGSCPRAPGARRA